jgi:hypothetical protein
VENHGPPRGGAILTRGGGNGHGAEHPLPIDTTPTYDLDGFVAVRPSLARYDEPMYESYHWVAMLDPVELADGAVDEWPRPGSIPTPIEVESLIEVDHFGRQAWEALCRPTATYDPRCSCCPLMLSTASDAREADGGAPGMGSDFVFADGHRIRLDVETGVCVFSEERGGTRNGWGHELRIEAVDETVPRELFTPQPKGWLRRGFGR